MYAGDTAYRGQLQALLEIAYRGLQDGDHSVRNASLFAIGQFSDHLQVSGDLGWENAQERESACLLHSA